MVSYPFERPTSPATPGWIAERRLLTKTHDPKWDRLVAAKAVDPIWFPEELLLPENLTQTYYVVHSTYDNEHTHQVGGVTAQAYAMYQWEVSGNDIVIVCYEGTEIVFQGYPDDYDIHDLWEREESGQRVAMMVREPKALLGKGTTEGAYIPFTINSRQPFTVEQMARSGPREPLSWGTSRPDRDTIRVNVMIDASWLK